MNRLALALPLIAITVTANADSLRSQIDSMDKSVQKAMMARDIDAFTNAEKGFVTKDFKYTERGKASSFDQMISDMKGAFGKMSKITVADSKTLKLVEKGNTAICNTQHKMMGVIVDPKKKSHTMGFTGVSIETYQKVNGKWLWSSMSWKSQSMTMDGKVTAP